VSLPQKVKEKQSIRSTAKPLTFDFLAGYFANFLPFSLQLEAHLRKKLKRLLMISKFILNLF
jgi:hypothetical protein